MGAAVCVLNRRAQCLLTQRAPGKSHAGLWESPGGALQAGETPAQGALRELYEETGIRAGEEELLLVRQATTGRGHETVYLLRRDLPAGEVVLRPGETVDALWADGRLLQEMLGQGRITPSCAGDVPDMQRWMIEAADREEWWDLVDVNGRPLGREHRRGEMMAPGTYHLVVNVWVFDSRGRVLLTQRSPEKAWSPLLWETTGGAVRTGESPRLGAARELFEETGILADPGALSFVASFTGERLIAEVYQLCRDLELSQLTLQPGETVDARWAGEEELEAMARQGLLTEPMLHRLPRIRKCMRQAFEAGRESR